MGKQRAKQLEKFVFKGGLVIVANDRSQLDACLNDVTTVVLVLYGPHAREVHDFVSTTRADNSCKWDSWQREVLIGDEANITADEKQAWFSNSSDRYAVLRNRGPGSPKQVVRTGPIAQLLPPDCLKIRRVFLTQPPL